MAAPKYGFHVMRLCTCVLTGLPSTQVLRGDAVTIFGSSIAGLADQYPNIQSLIDEDRKGEVLCGLDFDCHLSHCVDCVSAEHLIDHKYMIGCKCLHAHTAFVFTLPLFSPTDQALQILMCNSALTSRLILHSYVVLCAASGDVLGNQGTGRAY